jgi:SsrA-binding protein
MKIIANNKKAHHDYTLMETFEAGIVLQGTEVKSLRAGKCSIKESFIQIKNNEAWLVGATISMYSHGNLNNHEEQRSRKLLLHKKEIVKIENEIKIQRLSVVPTKIYFTKGKVKLEFALGKGKKNYDKRQDESKKSVERKLRQGDY